MSDALAGRVGPVLTATARVGDLDPATRAWSAYARSVALANAGRPDLTLVTCTEALPAAAELADGGAECLLRLMRVGLAPRLAVEASGIDDLVGAEAALARTTDPAVRGWCGFGFGWTCTELNLPEMALAHLAAAPTAALVPEQATLVELVRVTALLQQAEQVELVGGDPGGADPAELRGRAADHARTAAELVAAARDAPGWSPEARRRWGAATAEVALVLSGWREDPAGAVRSARAALDGGRGRVAVTGLGHLPAVLVRSLAALGDPARALAEGAALLARPRGVLSPAGELTLRHALLEVSAAGGDAVAVNALAVTVAQARSLVAEHRRGAVAVQDALALRRVTAAHEAERRAAREDPLTRVGNRRALDEAVAAAQGSTVAVLVIDVDDFKTLNDGWGHAAGDEVLVAVAGVLRAQCRAEDQVFRTGGDEFVVLARGADHAAADAIGARVGAAVGELRLEGLRADQLLPAADQRMYVAKRARRRAGHRPTRVGGGDPVRSDRDAAAAGS
ncbi:hypothetical protein GCM10027047_03780 [Rhodococcus aerolatus]